MPRLINIYNSMKHNSWNVCRDKMIKLSLNLKEEIIFTFSKKIFQTQKYLLYYPHVSPLYQAILFLLKSKNFKYKG